MGLPQDRESAATAYGRILKPEGIDPLLALLKDKSKEVRRAAIFALGQLGWDATFAGGREMEIARNRRKSPRKTLYPC